MEKLIHRYNKIIVGYKKIMPFFCFVNGSGDLMLMKLIRRGADIAWSLSDVGYKETH